MSAKGGAYGFKMDIIEKGNDVKASDNKTTLLMYLLDLVEK
jgi:diaphanous 1